MKILYAIKDITPQQAQSNIYDIHLHDFIRINFSRHSKDTESLNFYEIRETLVY